MSTAIQRERILDRRDRPRGLRPAPATGFTSSTATNVDTQAVPAAGARSVDVTRLFVAVVGLGLYVGVPAAAIGWLVVSFVSRIGAGG